MSVRVDDDDDQIISNFPSSPLFLSVVNRQSIDRLASGIHFFLSFYILFGPLLYRGESALVADWV